MTNNHWMKVLIGVITTLSLAVGVIILSYLYFQTAEASVSMIGRMVDHLDSEHQEQ